MPKAWIDSVAARAEVDTKLVEEVLTRRGIQADRKLRHPKRIVVTHVHFHGKKTGRSTEEFNFDWQVSSGLWALTSYDNFVGKSSVIEIVLWVLRGEPKGLQADVRHWLQHVRLDFDVEDRRFVVEFDVEDGSPRGTVHLVSGEETTQVEEFESEVSFASAMASLMMDELGLEPIPSAQKNSADEVQLANHGWVALSGVMYIGGDHSVLLGDVNWAGLPGRLLQVYLGLPWSRTIMQARTANKIVAGEEQRKWKTLDAIAARDRDTAGRLQRELADARGKLEQLEPEAASARKASALAVKLPSLITKLREVEGEIAELRAKGAEATAIADDDDRALRNLREDRAAAVFFNGVRPHHCPRCQGEIGIERLESELKKKQCSVCLTPVQVEEPDPDVLHDAEQRAKASAAAVKEIGKLIQPLLEHAQALRQELEQSRQAAEQFATRDTTDLHKVQIEIARLEGALSSIVLSEPAERTRSVENVVIDAAVAEAMHRFQETQRKILSDLNGHVSELAIRFGIVSLEAVELTLLGQMKVTKGGEQTYFSKLTPGERLRLRIATAIGLLRVGKQTHLGRHPGLLIIDSPAAEEITDENLDTLIAELNAVATEMADLQIIIATAKADDVLKSIDHSRVRVAPKGQYLW